MVFSTRLSKIGSLHRGMLVVRNTAWNIFGYGFPAFIALFAIPALISGLGASRFGVLSIAWTVVGYLSLIDLGLGRATTKLLTPCFQTNDGKQLAELAAASLLAHAGVGLLGGMLIALLTPWFSGTLFLIPSDLQSETRIVFYLLALSVPMIVVTSSARGILEAAQKFELINLIKIPASSLNYLAPLLVLPFSHSLIPIVGMLVVNRAVVMFVYLAICNHMAPLSLSPKPEHLDSIRGLLSFAGWAILSGLIAPVTVSIDRFALGAQVSMESVAYYTAPFEIVTRMVILSASFVTVLFPIFSAMGRADAKEISLLSGRALRCLFLMVCPLVGLLLVFIPDLLSLWLGAEYAQHSTPAARILTLGILIHMLGFVPFTVLQGFGRADITAKLQLAQMLPYCALIWYMAGAFGIEGVALAWTGRVAIDALLLFNAENRIIQVTPRLALFRGIAGMALASLIFLAGCWIIPILVRPPWLRVVVAVGWCLGISLWNWRFLLGCEDRRSVSRALSSAILNASKGRF